MGGAISRRFSALMVVVFLLAGLPLGEAKTRSNAPEVAYIDVNTKSDVIDENDNQCSLREAIIAANTNTRSGPGAAECTAGTAPQYDVITLGSFQYELLLAGEEDNALAGDLDVYEDLKINGNGWDETAVESIVSDRVFEVWGETEFSLQDLTVKNGYVKEENLGGGGILIHADGTARAYDVRFWNNLVDGNLDSNRGGAVYVGHEASFYAFDCIFEANESRIGGAIFVNSSGYADVERSLVRDNHAREDGGAIFNYGVVHVTNSTITGNSAGDQGSAIASGDALYFLSSTIVGNSAPSPAITMFGGNIQFEGTILADNINTVSKSDHNCQPSARFYDCRDNIFGDGSCVVAGTNNLVANPLLWPLAKNGGPTETFALRPRSPAIDLAVSGSHCSDLDQRKMPRPVDGDRIGGAVCDAGAYELQYLNFLPVIRR